MKELFNHYRQVGKVVWIGVRPARRSPVSALNEVMAVEQTGLAGDRYDKGGTRQVTLIQAEHLQAVASILGITSIAPALTRRNIVVSDINLISLKGKRFHVGNAILEYSGECHPCSRMEENLGIGGYNAMRGHGGITAKIVHGGKIKLGDEVQVVPKIEAAGR